MNFFDVSLKRRSVNYFDSNVSIDDESLKKIIDLAQFCPSSSNLQPWKIFVVRDAEKKALLRSVAFDQPKVTEASANFVLLGDKEGFKPNNPSYQNFVKNGYMTEEALAGYIKMIEGLYAGLQSPESFALRNTSLFASVLMYSAKFFGWDTHPMIGFNPASVSEKFNIPDRYIPVLIIAIGKFDKSKTMLKRNERLTMNDFCSIDTFKDNSKVSFDNIFFNNKKVTLHGNEFNLSGITPEIKQPISDVNVISNDLKPITISMKSDKPVVISSVPSLDTPVCSIQTKKLNEFLDKYKDKINFMTISCDTPFAQKRFCTEEEINYPAYSDYLFKEFSINFGVLISELNLSARSIFIVDTNGKLAYKQIVNEISEEPDYDAVMSAIDNL